VYLIINLKKQTMKNLIRKSLVIISMLMVMLGHTSETAKDSINESNQIKLVKFTNAEKGSSLLIKDENGLVLYRENINKDGPFLKRFDFSNLPDGSYFFELDNEKEINILPFTTSKGMAHLENEARKSISKPEVVIENEMVFISNKSSEKQNMDINVYYKGDDLAYKESIKNQETIARTYDFSTSMKGNYTIILTTEGRRFVNNISIP